MDSLLQAKTIIAQALQTSVDKIGDDATIDDVGEMDSVMFAGIVMQVEKLLGKEIDATKWLSLRSVKDLAGIIEKNHT